MTQPVESATVDAMVGGDGEVTELVVVMLGVAAVLPDSAPALLEAMTLDDAVLAGGLEEAGGRLSLASCDFPIVDPRAPPKTPARPKRMIAAIVTVRRLRPQISLEACSGSA